MKSLNNHTTNADRFATAANQQCKGQKMKRDMSHFTMSFKFEIEQWRQTLLYLIKNLLKKLLIRQVMLGDYACVALLTKA